VLEVATEGATLFLDTSARRVGEASGHLTGQNGCSTLQPGLRNVFRLQRYISTRIRVLGQVAWVHGIGLATGLSDPEQKYLAWCFVQVSVSQFQDDTAVKNGFRSTAILTSCAGSMTSRVHNANQIEKPQLK
jgi:hypothetical protein